MGFTRFDNQGSTLTVNIGDRAGTKREAMTGGSIFMSPQRLEKVAQRTTAKGDMLGVAKVTGIMGAKKTSELVPLYHILNPTKLTVDFTTKRENSEIEAVCAARTMGKTGVEMEALTGMSVALLTIYGICKTMDKSTGIEGIYLEHKSRGKDGGLHSPGCVRGRG